MHHTNSTTADVLRDRLLDLTAQPADALDRDAALDVFQTFREALEAGTVRAAARDAKGRWHAHAWVKQGILLGFRLGRLVDYTNGGFPFFDKDTYPLRPFSLEGGVRIVPGGSAVRSGSYLAPGVVAMPPMYVNVGAYVDEGTMIDSHALVGSCAQIGKRVHLSAAVQVGGVLEPVGALPVIVEDDAFIGGGCGLYEGCIVREGAVLAPGVTLTGSTRIYDLARERTHRAERGRTARSAGPRRRGARQPSGGLGVWGGARPIALRSRYRQVPRRQDRRCHGARRGATQPRLAHGGRPSAGPPRYSLISPFYPSCPSRSASTSAGAL